MNEGDTTIAAIFKGLTLKRTLQNIDKYPEIHALYEESQ